MTSIQPTGQVEKTALHWPSLLQLGLSLLAAFGLISAAVVVIITTALRYYSPTSGAPDPTASLMVAASLVFGGALVLPSAWYAWKYIAHPEQEAAPHPRKRSFGLLLTIVVIVLVGGALALGNWSSQNNRPTWLLLPPLNLIATGLPALWFIYMGTRGLIANAPRRQWGVFASGLVLGPLIILVLELLLLVFIGILALLWTMLNPTMANQLSDLLIRIQGGSLNTNDLLRSFIPFLVNPGILFLGFAFISVLVPLLEEALKPIGVWFLYSQKISPAQGFAYGVLSGAGFGLFENLGNTSGGGTEWAVLASTRISTLMLHCFTAGLVGWALASAWSERRYLRLAITFAIAAIIHGLWNGMAILSAASSLNSITNISLPPFAQQIGAFSTYGIIALGVLVLLLYLASNTFLQRSLPEPAHPPTDKSTIPPMPGAEPPNPDSDLHQPQNDHNSTTTTGLNE